MEWIVIYRDSAATFVAYETCNDIQEARLYIQHLKDINYQPIALTRAIEWFYS